MSYKTCENCGERVYSLGCTWCDEARYIEAQDYDNDRDRNVYQTHFGSVANNDAKFRLAQGIDRATEGGSERSEDGTPKEPGPAQQDAPSSNRPTTMNKDKITPYLQHKPDCVHGKLIVAGCDVGAMTDVCTCGLDELLRELEVADSPDMDGPYKVAVEELWNIVRANRYDRDCFESDTSFANWVISRSKHALERIKQAQAGRSSLTGIDIEQEAERRHPKCHGDIAQAEINGPCREAFIEGARFILSIKDGKGGGDAVPIAERQYYYRSDGCPATLATDPGCTCWHDEGTGPMKDEPSRIKEWRTKPMSKERKPIEKKVSKLVAFMEANPKEVHDAWEQVSAEWEERYRQWRANLSGAEKHAIMAEHEEQILREVCHGESATKALFHMGYTSEIYRLTKELEALRVTDTKGAAGGPKDGSEADPVVAGPEQGEGNAQPKSVVSAGTDLRDQAMQAAGLLNGEYADSEAAVPVFKAIEAWDAALSKANLGEGMSENNPGVDDK